MLSHPTISGMISMPVYPQGSLPTRSSTRERRKPNYYSGGGVPEQDDRQVNSSSSTNEDHDDSSSDDDDVDKDGDDDDYTSDSNCDEDYDDDDFVVDNDRPPTTKPCRQSRHVTRVKKSKDSNSINPRASRVQAKSCASKSSEYFLPIS